MFKYVVALIGYLVPVWSKNLVKRWIAYRKKVVVKYFDDRYEQFINEIQLMKKLSSSLLFHIFHYLDLAYYYFVL